MYAPPFVSAVPPHRDYPFTSAFPLRWALLRPVEEMRRAPRKGKWIVEEEEYTQKIIECFNKGFLNIPPGTTLRSCLSEKLNCDPMRITKKFAGSACIGKQVYQPCEKTADSDEDMKKAQAELAAIERKFLSKIEHVARPHRYPYVVYGTEPVMMGPDTAPADLHRGSAHDFPHHAHAHAHPYLSYAAPRTFFPPQEIGRGVMSRPLKAEVSPKSPIQSPLSEVTRAVPEKVDKNERDVDGGGLLLSFIKSVHGQGQSQRSQRQQGKDEGGHADSDDDEDSDDATEDQEEETDKAQPATSKRPKPRKELKSPSSPSIRSTTAGTPKRPSTTDEGLSSSSRKRRVPETFVTQAAYAQPSFAHPRAAIPATTPLVLEHRVPVPPVPPLDMQALHAFPYTTARSYLPDYAYPPIQHCMTDPLRRMPYPVYEGPHTFQTSHAAHALHAAHVHPLAAYASYAAVAGHPPVPDAHSFAAPPITRPEL